MKNLFLFAICFVMQSPVQAQVIAPNPSVSTASGATMPRAFANHFADHYNVKDFGAKVDGITDDTAAWTAASLAASQAGGGTIEFNGTSRICGAIIYRNTSFKGQHRDSSILMATSGCSGVSGIVYSENFASNAGTGKYCGHDASVPYYMGLQDLTIDGQYSQGNTANVDGVALYGASLFFDNIVVANVPAYSGTATTTEAIYTENSSSANVPLYGAKCKEEAVYRNVSLYNNHGWGWRYRGPTDSQFTDITAGFNGDWGFYTEANSGLYSGSVDKMDGLHTYANGSNHGIHLGAPAKMGQVIADGDYIEIPYNNVAISQLALWGCGNGNSCLNVSGLFVQIGTINFEWFFIGSYTSPLHIINWSGGYGAIGQAILPGNTYVTPTGSVFNLVNTASGNHFNDVMIKGWNTANFPAFSLQGNNNTVKLLASDNYVNLNASNDYGGNIIDASLYSNSGETNITGAFSATDTIRVVDAGQDMNSIFQSPSSLDSNVAISTLTGTTAGSIAYSMPAQGTAKKEFVGYASGYSNNTTTSQTIVFPKAFLHPPTLIANSTGLTISAPTTTGVTIVSPNNATTSSGNIIISGF